MENLTLILTVIILVLSLVYLKRRTFFTKKLTNKGKNIFDNKEDESFENQTKSNKIFEIALLKGNSVPNSLAKTPYTSADNDIVVNPTILIVDNNTYSRNQMASLFHDRNTVLTAENGIVALETLKLTPSVSLIISDIELPLMNGFQLLTTLKAKENYHHIPFIMMTERVDLQHKLKALRIGVDDYLIKPFEQEELLVRVDNLLKNYSERLKFYLETHQQTATSSEQTANALLTPEEIEWMEHLEKYIRQHMSDINLTAEDIAEGLCVSRAQLFRRVKKLTGLTPHSYLNEVRFNYARKCLENRTYTSVKSVSYAVGMKQLSHFSHQFKLRFGKNPSDYFH